MKFICKHPWKNALKNSWRIFEEIPGDITEGIEKYLKETFQKFHLTDEIFKWFLEEPFQKNGKNRKKY